MRGTVAICLLLSACIPQGYHSEGVLWDPKHPFVLLPTAPDKPIAVYAAAPRTPDPWELEADNRCRLEEGDYKLCLANKQQQYVGCISLKTYAYNALFIIKTTGASSGATPRQVVEANMGNISEYPLGQAITLDDYRDMLSLAVQDAPTTTPDAFAAMIFRRCWYGG